MTPAPDAQDKPFRVDEATIDELHAAIKSGRTTCRRGRPAVHRPRARLQRRRQPARDRGRRPDTGDDGRRARMAPLRFPTETVKASTVLPDLHKYTGPALEFGRMEATASDPSVPQQYGMIVGKPNAGQVNALATLNIRGERSVTCRGDFDRHPSARAAAAGAPPVCEMFRRLPDALERAAELDADVWTQSRSRDDADVRRRLLVQGSVRHEGHAHHRPAATRATTSISRRAITCWSSSSATRARSSSPRRSTPNTTGAPAIRAAATRPDKVLPSTLGYQRSTWAAIRQIRTTRRARPRSARARGRACRSAPIS